MFISTPGRQLYNQGALMIVVREEGKGDQLEGAEEISKESEVDQQRQG